MYEDHFMCLDHPDASQSSKVMTDAIPYLFTTFSNPCNLSPPSYGTVEYRSFLQYTWTDGALQRVQRARERSMSPVFSVALQLVHVPASAARFQDHH